MRSRFLAPLCVLLVLADPLGATWSIVCVNTRTREVGVGSATCIPSISLKSFVPVIVVGKGAAAAQSAVDANGTNRRLIAVLLRAEQDTPDEILAALAATDPEHQGRQYGIVNFTGEPATFSGNGALAAALGVTGHVGDYVYAIQGNILTGNQVVLAAEIAFRETKGDMGQRIMAAMEAARSFGGDGRCSCNMGLNGTACGSPPPNFEKSAHIGTVVVARVGDFNGPCNGTHGCAQGEYYLSQNVIHDETRPDPVFTLQKRYDIWRERLVGRVDAIHSRVEVKPPADGNGERGVTVELRDVDGNRVLRGGATIEVRTVDGATPLIPVGPVVDRGDGRYTLTLGAGRHVGLERLVLRVSDPLPGSFLGVVTATLVPPIEPPVLGVRR